MTPGPLLIEPWADPRIKIREEQFAPEVLPIVKAALDEVAWLIPGWCQNLTVNYDSEGKEGTCLRISANLAYRYGHLTVYPLWLNGSPEGRREDLIHEMLHLSINPLYDYARNTLDAALTDQEPFRKHVHEQMTGVLEAAICDLAFQIRQKVPAT